jgi:hypothetical protein
MLIVPSWVPTLIGSVALALASGLVGWIWALWRDHHALRVKIAEEYPKNTALNEFKEEIRQLRDVVYRIAMRLEVPVIRRD